MILLLALLVVYLIAGLIWLSNVVNDNFDAPSDPLWFRVFLITIAPWCLLIAALEGDFREIAEELWAGIRDGRDD